MWWFIDYGFYGAITVFLAWGSVERHILVFHNRRFLRTQKQRFFIHYLPLIIISIYLLGFYIGVIFFPPCENTFDFDSLACGLSPCYEEVSYLNIWDYLCNGIICTFIETVSSIILLIRVLMQKHRVHQLITWRKHRKMAFQLLSVSCLSLTIVFPQSLIIVIKHVGELEMDSFGERLDSYLFYFYTYVVFLLPFICLAGLPELWKNRWLFNRKHQRKIVSMTLIPLGHHTITVRAKPS